MKRLLSTLALCLGVLAAMAGEPINIGVRGGMSSNRIKFHDVSEIKGSEAATGYMVGAFIRLNMGKFYLEPAVQFSHKKSVAQGNKRLEQDNRPKYNLKMNTVDVPIMAGLRMIDLGAGCIRTYLGPVICFGNVKNLHELGDTMESVDRTNVRGKVGMGLDLGRFTFDVDYERGFTKLSHELKSPRSYNFTLGFKLI